MRSLDNFCDRYQKKILNKYTEKIESNLKNLKKTKYI